MNNEYDKAIYAYQTESWGKRSNFTDDFINFGYWDFLNPNEPITQKQRSLASKRLYDICILKSLNSLHENSNVLEIGFGYGGGLEHVCRKHPQINFYGVDLIKKHYEHMSNKKYNHKNIINLYHDNIEVFDPEIQFDFIFSIEVIQHIINIDKFAKCLKKILKPGHKICLSAHLTNSPEDRAKYEKLISFSDVDILTPIHTVIDLLSKNNFEDIQYHTISNDVFKGYNAWIEQNNIGFNSDLIYEAFTKKMIDYYVITAKLSERHQHEQT